MRRVQRHRLSRAHRRLRADRRRRGAAPLDPRSRARGGAARRCDRGRARRRCARMARAGSPTARRRSPSSCASRAKRRRASTRATRSATRPSTRRAGSRAARCDAESARGGRDRLRAQGLDRRRPIDARRAATCDALAARRVCVAAQRVALSTRQLATLTQSGHAARPGARRRSPSRPTTPRVAKLVRRAAHACRGRRIAGRRARALPADVLRRSIAGSSPRGADTRPPGRRARAARRLSRSAAGAAAEVHARAHLSGAGDGHRVRA